MSRDMGRVATNRRHLRHVVSCRRHVGDMCNIDELLDEEEMEEGSVGEAQEDESGELMFGDESGGEEDWNDGSDESDSEWDEE